MVRLEGVKDVAGQLLSKGEVVRGFVGMTMQELPLSYFKENGLAETGGVLVKQVVPDLAAERAKLPPPNRPGCALPGSPSRRRAT